MNFLTIGIRLTDIIVSSMNDTILKLASYIYDGSLLKESSTARLDDDGIKNNDLGLFSGQGKISNGINQYADLSYIHPDTNFTINIRCTRASNTINTIFGGGEIHIKFDINGYIVATYNNVSISSNQLYTVGTSTQISFVLDGSTMYLYVFGVLQGSVSVTTVSANTSLYLFARNNLNVATDFSVTTIQDFSIYSVPLSPEQILRLYEYPEYITKNSSGGVVPSIGSTNDCEAFYPMNENSGFVIHDVSKNQIVTSTIVNGNSTCSSGARRLAYGAQTISWNKDTLGVPMSINGKLNFDNNSSVKPVFTNWYPSATEAWAVCMVMEVINDGTNRFNGVATDSKIQVRIAKGETGILQAVIFDLNMVTPNAVLDGYYFIVAEFNPNVVPKCSFYVNNILIASGNSISTTAPTAPFCIGAQAVSPTTYSFPLNKSVQQVSIWESANFANYNRDKVWAEAKKLL